MKKNVVSQSKINKNVFEKKKRRFVKWENFCFKPAQCQKNTPENKKQSGLVLFPD